jgi:hypothetical protein
VSVKRVKLAGDEGEEMKIIIMTIISLASYASLAATQSIVTKVKTIDYRHGNLVFGLQHFEHKIIVPTQHPIAPCLENAIKSNMEVQLQVDIAMPTPVIKSCRLYSGSLPSTLPDSMQAQEAPLAQ